ncbi:MAG: carboxypeptidase regulatory-like domain-containing protein [Deltaproteobacteria bacterium]|nr:carboxypeptidase regulatory-like domain-containing protein [Deltaproteobacteria bacterium]
MNQRQHPPLFRQPTASTAIKCAVIALLALLGAACSGSADAPGTRDSGPLDGLLTKPDGPIFADLGDNDGAPRHDGALNPDGKTTADSASDGRPPADGPLGDGPAKDGCTNACAFGDKRCAGAGASSGVETCVNGPAGCTIWGPSALCGSGKVCKNNSCVSGCIDECGSGDVSCDPQGGVRKCIAQGGCLVWDQAQPCPPTTACNLGRCEAASLTITTDTELCGEQNIAGTFTVQGGAKVTCKSGSLRINAKNILIDPQSTIDLSETSDSPGGENGRQCSYRFSGGGGGSYGGPGNNGEVIGYNANGCGSCGGGKAGAIRGDAYHDAITAGFAGGSGCAKTSCTASSPPGDWTAGGKGGGEIQLIADEKVTVYGTLRARGGQGQSTATSSASGGGGGSGGGVLIRGAEVDLSSTAVVDLSGGAPGSGPGQKPYYCSSTTYGRGGTGGEGRLIVIHGEKITNKATIDGVASASWMPPTDLSSTSHPDKTLAYNDDFQDFSVSWSQPFAQVQGYYTILDDNPATQLTAANGSYTTTTQQTFAVSKFTKPGYWYFHLLSVHQSAALSTIATRFRLWINSTPHSISSPSHPDDKTWYSDPAKKTVSLNWQAPGEVPDASFKGYWYRIDRVSNTSPTGAKNGGWTFSPNMQLIVATDHSGAALSDDVYYFHLVSEDTIGNLTRQAAHYRLQLGSEPAKIALFGYVKDNAGAPVAGAKVRIEPYGREQTTDANGYFLFSDTYELDYVLTVAESGTTKLTRKVTVNSAASPLQLALP